MLGGDEGDLVRDGGVRAMTEDNGDGDDLDDCWKLVDLVFV